MPDGNEASVTQAATNSQGQAPNPQTATPQAGQATPTSQTTNQPASASGANGNTGKSAEDYERMVSELRKENAQHRTELKKFQDAQAAADLAKLGDLERANKQLETVTKQAETFKARIADMAVQLAAGKLGIRDPEVAATLIREKLEIGDDGAPTNADELLKDLLKAKPYLKAEEQQQQQQQPKPNTGATNAGRGTPANPASGQTTVKSPDQMARFGRAPIFQTGRNRQ